MNAVSIAGRKVGPGQPCYIIAEIGSNHGGRLDLAKRHIAAAAKAGADAVKFQSIIYDQIFVPGLETAAHARFFKQLELREDWYAPLKNTAADHGVHFFSSPTYDRALPLLEKARVPAYKLASPQAVANLPLVRKTAALGKPIILSTGYCGLAQIEAAVRACEEAGNRKLVLLHCVSEYPTLPAKVNLRAIRTLAERFGYPTGFSDHTLGNTAAIAAAALGAVCLEKHFTLDRSLPGPDHSFASEPAEFKALVRAVRDVEAMLGDGVKRPTPVELAAAKKLQLRLIAAQPLAPGAALKKEDLIFRRAAYGLTPEDARWALRRVLRRKVAPGEPLLKEHLEVSR